MTPVLRLWMFLKHVTNMCGGFAVEEFRGSNWIRLCSVVSLTSPVKTVNITVQDFETVEVIHISMVEVEVGRGENIF